MNFPSTQGSAKFSSVDYRGIDLTKFIMAFAVVAIHAPEYLWPEARNHTLIIEWFIRLAVPFFFICSGFLIQKKLISMDNYNCRRKYLMSRSFKFLKIWGIWLLIYLPLSLWGYMGTDKNMTDVLRSFLSDIFLTGHSLYSQQLWFIYSMSIVIFIWSFATKTKRSLFILFLLFCLISIVRYYFKSTLLTNISIWILGGGSPLMTGALIQIYSKNLSNHKRWVIIAIALSISLINYYQQLYYSELFGAIALFYLSIAFYPNWKMNFIALRKDSMWIYYIHMYIIMTFSIILNKFSMELPVSLLFIVLCLVCCMTAMIMRKVSNMSRFHFLNELI